MSSHGSDEEEEMEEDHDEMEEELKKEEEEPKKEELSEEEKQWRDESRHRLDYQTKHLLRLEDENDPYLRSMTKGQRNTIEMIQAGLDEPVVFQLLKMFESGWIKYEEMTDKLKTGLCSFTPKQGVQFLKVMWPRDLTFVANKCAYLLGQMRVFNFYIRRRESIFNGPDPKKIEELLQMTGYTIKVCTGQRLYGGPPPDWEGPPPTHREISVSKIPHDWYEDTLVPLLSQYGKIYELRIMIDNITGWTRNFCFVQFCSENDNERALRKIDGYNYEEKKSLKANFSSRNKRLFVGNIPKTTGKEEINSVFSQFVPDITGVEVFVSDEMNKNGLKNRGFCFMDFKDHKAAALGKKILAGLGPKVYSGDKLKVEWFEEQQPCSHREFTKCKTIHVGNVSTEVTEDSLMRTFEQYGKIKLVEKVRDYAFIHMEDRDCALRAIEALDGSELSGFLIKCAISESGPLKRKVKKKAEARRLRGERKKKQPPPPPKMKSSWGDHGGGRFGGFGRDRYGGDRWGGGFGRDRWGGGYRRDRKEGGYGRDRWGGGGKYKSNYGYGGQGYGGGGGGYGGKRKRDDGYGGGHRKYRKR